MSRSVKLIQMLEQDFPSRYGIGDPVFFSNGSVRMEANVRTVTFTSGKVRYSLAVMIDNGEGHTTIHNVDSVSVEPRPEGTKLDFGFDNYS